MQKLVVDLSNRSYPIYIKKGILNDKNIWCEHLTYNEKVMVVSNETVLPLFHKKIKTVLPGAEIIQIADGEKYKTIETLEKIYTQLLEKNFNRNSVLVALGGGVVGDITGFAAATYQRGIDFIQVPTTLLAQVDSSVGGKTGVNHQLGKNMIGAFHQPRCVIIDIETLKSLPSREFRAGIAEIIKYGLIIDPDFFFWLESNIQKLISGDEDALGYAIYNSCKLKAQIVSTDEKEKGIRAILNLGHTFGHAIEAWGNYCEHIHGEAVAIGMVIAAKLSEKLGLIRQNDFTRVIELIEKAGLPVAIPETMNNDDFLRYMQKDKKNVNGVIRLILLNKIGEAKISENCSFQDITSALADVRDLNNIK